MKIAEFKSLEFEWTTFADESYEDYSGYFRLTEYVDVEFVPLPAEVTVPIEIAALEKIKEKAAKKHAGIIATIDDRISKLLAITHQPAAA